MSWKSQQGSLVFDSWESIFSRYSHLCAPFLTQAAQQMIEKHGIETVLLGKGGQTPASSSTWKHLGASQTEHPKDYHGYRDSTQQYLLARKTVAPTSPITVDTSSPHSIADCNQALQHIFSDHPNVLLLPASIENSLDSLSSAKKMLEQSDNANTLIMPMLLDDGWQAYLLHKGARISDRWLSGPVKYESAFFITHLNPNPQRIISGYRIAETPLTQSYRNLQLSKQETGVWLLERLQAFAQSGYITLPPTFNAPLENRSLVAMLKDPSTSREPVSQCLPFGELTRQQRMHQSGSTEAPNTAADRFSIFHETSRSDRPPPEVRPPADVPVPPSPSPSP